MKPYSVYKTPREVLMSLIYLVVVCNVTIKSPYRMAPVFIFLTQAVPNSSIQDQQVNLSLIIVKLR